MRRFLLGGVLLLAPFLQPDAHAQAANWRVTVLSISGGGYSHPCPPVTVTVTIPAPTGTVNTALCGGNGRFTVNAQNVVLEITGAYVDTDGCKWEITTTLRGSGFISGNSVPSTSMTGRVHITCPYGTYDTDITGSFQAQRVVAGSGAAIGSFTGGVQVTLPGGAPIVLTPANIGGLNLTVGTQIQVGAGGSITLTLASGDVQIGENTDFKLATQRFFLLTPPRFPLRGSFTRIRWRCIPVTNGCVSLAMPNARLAFLPPIASIFGAEPRAAEEDVDVSVSYTQTGGLGTASVTVNSGRVDMQNLRGVSTLLTAGAQGRVATLVAGGVPLNLNGDATPDVFRYDPAAGAWAMEPGGGSSTVSGTWSPDWSVAPGDFDGNGLTDFLLLNAASGSGRVAINTGAGGFTETPLSWSPTSGWRAYVLNLNGDRLSDLFVHQSATGQWIQFINQGSTFQSYTGQWASGWTPYPLDLDGDDDADLLLFNATSGQWSWAVNNGTGGFTLSASGQWTGVTDVYPGDFTADGRWEALLYDSRTGAWSLATNTGSGFSYRTGTASSGRDVVVADVDADGDADALLYDSGSGGWTILLSTVQSDGTAQLSTGATGTWASHWRIAATDFNSDGRADFFLFYPEAGAWRKATNTALGAFTYEDGSWAPGLTVVSNQTLTQGLLPTEAATASCADEVNLRSPGGAGAQSIEFTNMSSELRRIYWLNGAGRRVLYRTLAPGERYHQSSPRQDVWVAADAIGRCRAIYVAGETPSRAAVQ